ncbi:MAG: hypothetical protein NT127_06675 [Sphingobacteriales bacterium]|nr:hypothetical protein [Sphingobacteriales bacterium]
MNRKSILIIAAIIVLIILIISKCNCRSETNTVAKFVNPPIKQADVPFTDYTVDASKGDTIMYSSGSVLLFPPDAFVDKNGNVVKGDVKIKYREFSNPVDQFLSGIPMDYDSGGVKYTFESAGMCDIQAFKNGEPVFVNKNSKPEINLATSNIDPAQNLYYLDTVSQQWVNRGKSEILVMGKSNVVVKSPIAEEIEVSKPVQPYKVDEELPIIKVTIDSGSFAELMAYNNLKFQLDKSENRFNGEDSKIIWDDIKLKKGSQYGMYNIQFSKASEKINKSVEYKVRPVLEEKDYAKAIRIYDNQLKKYNQKIEARKMADKDQYRKDSLEITKENNKIDRLNKIIAAKNAMVEKSNAEILARNKSLEKQDLEIRAFRAFAIKSFGVWNCDFPMLSNSIYIQPHFVNKNGEPIKLFLATLFVKNLNASFKIFRNVVPVSLDKENMIVGVCDGRFAFITYAEFKKMNINTNTKSQTFPMQMVSEENNNYAFIKNLFKQ